MRAESPPEDTCRGCDDDSGKRDDNNHFDEGKASVRMGHEYFATFVSSVALPGPFTVTMICFVSILLEIF